MDEQLVKNERENRFEMSIVDGVKAEDDSLKRIVAASYEIWQRQIEGKQDATDILLYEIAYEQAKINLIHFRRSREGK